MTNQQLDQKLRDYYASQELPADKVDAMLETGKWIRPSRRRLQSRLLAVAAVLVAAVVTLWLLASPSITERAASEIAKNHSKQIAPEIRTESYQDIARHLDKLDFPIEPRRKALLTGLQVEGGRYCSIQGELAAQISLTDASGKPCTLYIAPLQGPVERVREATRREGNVTVHFWHDHGRLFALAR